MTIRLVIFACYVVAINSCAPTTGAFDIQESTQTDMRTAPNSRPSEEGNRPSQVPPKQVTRSQEPALPWTEVFKNLNAVGTKYGVEIRSDVAVGTEQVDHIAALTRKAYRFDRVLHDARAAALDRPLIVGLASDALAAGRGGFSALGLDALVGPLFRFSPDVMIR